MQGNVKLKETCVIKLIIKRVYLSLSETGLGVAPSGKEKRKKRVGKEKKKV